MTACSQCHTSYRDPAPRFCGRCGADLRVAATGAPPMGSAAAALPAVNAAATSLVGRVVAGRYRVLERIGAGGMGVVYRVEHTAIGKIAALKMLHPGLSSDRDLVKRFRTEARAISLLTHPNTVQVFDFGEADGALFMVMELVRGRDLSALLERDGPMPWRRLAPLLAQMCEALAEAHEAGVVHRDIKPENILVCRSRDGKESVKVLDFGLAKLAERPEPSDVTGRGTIVGTPFYMAPEQIRGEEPDARSDIYALGALAYRLLTGRYPFEGPKPVAVLTAHLTEPLTPMSQRRPDLKFDPTVEAIVARCLSRDPARRFTSADEVRLAIEASLEEHRQGAAAGVTTAVPVPSPEAGERISKMQMAAVVPPLSREDLDRFERALRRRGRLRLASLVALLVAAAGFGGWRLLFHGERPVTEEVEPNDSAQRANLIDNGLPVRGHIGKRLGPDTSDRDFYRFHVARGSVLLRLELSGLPDMDLHVAVYDSLSDKLAEADNGGDGEGEVIPNLRLGAGDYYVSVREAWVAGVRATENVTDWYTMRLSLREPAPDLEWEPDDTPADAIPAAPGQLLTGYLSRANDVDCFYPQGAAGGELAGRVSGIPGVDLRVVLVPAGSLVQGDPAAVRGARVFDAAGPGEPETFNEVAWPEGASAPLIVVLRKDKLPRVDGQGHRRSVVGVEVPYTLMLQRAGTKVLAGTDGTTTGAAILPAPGISPAAPAANGTERPRGEDQRQ